MQAQPHGRPPQERAIVVRDLEKSFGDVQAVRGVSFSVARGEVFGFLGPNGAGKTTTINMLTGLARPDAGGIELAGVDCTRRSRKAQALVGVAPDESNLYPELTGFENLCFCGALYGMGRSAREDRARELLDSFGLNQAAGRKFQGYSKGMKRKLTLAAAIMHDPGILFLDEPSTGIDVASVRQIRTLIEELNARGTTIFLTTHYIEEAERLCGRVAFIVAGRIVRDEPLEDLLAPVRGRHVLAVACDPIPGEGAARDLEAAFPGWSCSVQGDGALRVEAGEPVGVGRLVRFLEERGLEVLEARRQRPSLEDVFVGVTGLAAADLARGNGTKGPGKGGKS
ncbi:ABC transporter ATP-binding protein [Desulfocurvus sp. DL9XJH121]